MGHAIAMALIVRLPTGGNASSPGRLVLRATANGRIGAIHLLAKKLGLDQAIDGHLGLLRSICPATIPTTY